MSTLTRYILKRCVLATLYTILAMGFVLILPHVEPLIRSLAIGQISLAEFWYMWVLLYPMIFYLQMPLIVAFSIGVVYLLLARDKELIAAFVAGASPWRVTWPGLLSALFGAALCALMSLYLLPVTHLEFKNMIYAISKRVSAKALDQGKFHDIHGGYTLYYKERTRNGGMINVLLQDRSEPDKVVVVTARRGRFVHDRSDIHLVLLDGVVQRPVPESGTYVFVDFRVLRYPIGKAFDYASPAGRTWGYFERHIGALLRPPRHLKLSGRQRAEWMMEGHKRIINPVLCLAYGLLVVGLIAWASSWLRNTYWAIPFALAGIVGLHGAYIVVLSAFVHLSLDYPALLYSVPLLIFLDGSALLYFLMRARAPRQRVRDVEAMPAGPGYHQGGLTRKSRKESRDGMRGAAPGE